MAKNLGRTSLVLASGTLVSRVLGFVKAIVLVQTIGLVGSAGADAFANAQTLPANIYSLIAGGVLNAVLVPQIVRAAKQPDGGHTYVNRLVTLSATVLGALALIVTVGAPVISWFYGATLTGEQLGLVIAFAYWCLPQVFFYGLYAVLGEVLNARGVFAPFAWAPVLNNVVAIAGLGVFSAVYGADSAGDRAIGDWDPGMIAMLGGFTTLGVALQALVLFLFWPRAGLRFRPDFAFRGTGLGRAGKLAGWSFGMLIVLQVVGWVETLVANLSFGQAASVAAMQNAFLIFALPHSIITVTITTTMFTRMSEDAADGRMRKVISDFSGGTRTIGLFMILSMAAFIAISPAFARIFESSDSGLVALAWVMIAYLVGLLSYSTLYFVQRLFYALEDTRTVFLMYLATAPVHIGGLILCAFLVPTQWLIASLALVSSISSTLRLIVLTVILRRRLDDVDLPRIVRAFTQFLVAAIPAGGAGAVAMWLLGAYQSGGFARSGTAAAIVSCAVGGLVVLVVYLLALLAMHNAELLSAAAPVLRRFRGTPGRHASDTARHASGTANSTALAEEFSTLVDDVDAGLRTSLMPVADTPGGESSFVQATSELPSRRELRARERAAADAAERARDDEPLI